VQQGGGPAGTATKPLERLREPRFQEFSKLGCGPKLRNGLQILDRRSKCVGQAPDRPRPEFLILRLEVEVMHRSCKVLGSFQLGFDKRLVDDYLGADVCQLTSLPRLHLLSHGLEVPLHPINAHRDAVDEREGLRMFRQDRGEHT